MRCCAAPISAPGAGEPPARVPGLVKTLAVLGQKDIGRNIGQNLTF